MTDGLLSSSGKDRFQTSASFHDFTNQQTKSSHAKHSVPSGMHRLPKQSTHNLENGPCTLRHEHLLFKFDATGYELRLHQMAQISLRCSVMPNSAIALCGISGDNFPVLTKAESAATAMCSLSTSKKRLKALRVSERPKPSVPN